MLRTTSHNKLAQDSKLKSQDSKEVDKSQGAFSPETKLVYFLCIILTVFIIRIISFTVPAVAFPLSRIPRIAALIQYDIAESTVCQGWRHTLSCTHLGIRVPELDRGCNSWISGGSGFCECSGYAAQLTSCGAEEPGFTCQDVCLRTSVDKTAGVTFPPKLGCSENAVPRQEPPYLKEVSGRVPERPGNLSSLDLPMLKLWRKIAFAAAKGVTAPVHLPSVRTDKHDWVFEAQRMNQKDIGEAMGQWQSFTGDAPPYPDDLFSGKGVVILAGDLKYFVPAWVNVVMLRRTGCTLPVEMFFPISEYPPPSMEAALLDLGVWSRRLIEPTPEPKNFSNAALAGYSLKIAAAVLSRFEEVIFLDSDNVAVRDPSHLFDTPEYIETGLLVWPDYWAASAAPELARILGLDVHALPQGTFESGQMVFDKRKIWRGLLLSAFFNIESNTFFELLSNFMGKGDKEALPYAMLAVDLPFHKIPTGVGSFGLIRKACTGKGFCWPTFAGNTMVQHDTNGKILFLHTNINPKFNLDIPEDFKDYQRRWQVLLPGNTSYTALSKELGGDLEKEIYDVLALLRCAPYLEDFRASLAATRKKAGKLPLNPTPDGFHPIINGMDLSEAYAGGLPGPYSSFVRISAWTRVRFLFNRWAKRLFWRALRYWVG